ncbi:hypothetical protein [Chondromyces crocatus]|uniref:SnoaL-like domain-containing protein n=1 Tax=Chondromyces crocatus TaxID=52 RepID=A0A0K1E7C5_CHOCO|nr:hypothetical protein [Chondromyces crocatus]AKT36765.1 uncharacterized protein CMC5_008860 [Chondromyces crocatus]
MPADIRQFFEGYVDAFNRSLAGPVDSDGIRRHFAERFLAAGPGTVDAGNNDQSFVETLEKGYGFYRSIGTRQMRLKDVSVVPIDDAHQLVRVFYSADYERKNSVGEAPSIVTIDFDVTYVLQSREAGPLIVAFIAGDEMGLYRKHGLVPET